MFIYVYVYELAWEGRFNNKAVPSSVVYWCLPSSSYDQIYQVILRDLTDQTVLSNESNTQYMVIGQGQAEGQVFVEPPLALPGLLNTFLINLFDCILNL